MFANLKPDYYYHDIFAIDLVELKNQEIKGIICDIDNTIVPWQDDIIREEVREWFADLEKRGFRICLLSNGFNGRVEFISAELAPGITGIGRALKPGKKGYLQALSRLNLEKQQVAVIGDQIFTDILGGNRAGLKTILVDPLADREFITTRILRLLEKVVYDRRC